MKIQRAGWEVACIVAIVGLLLAIMANWPDGYSEVNVEGERMSVKLVEFDPSVKVGIGAPKLPDDKEPYLKAFAVVKNPRDHPYAEAMRFASESMKGIVNEENYNRVREGINQETMGFFQATVDYAVEVKLAQSGERYLAVGYRPGFVDGYAGPEELRTLSAFVWEDGKWKSCGKVKGFELIQNRLRLASLASLRDLVGSE